MLPRIFLAFALSALAAAATTEQWGMFELSLPGPATGNPFTEVELSARFTQGATSIEATGFYDGDGTYRVRFMPEKTGEWRYETRSNRAELGGKRHRLDDGVEALVRATRLGAGGLRVGEVRCGQVDAGALDAEPRAADAKRGEEVHDQLAPSETT